MASKNINLMDFIDFIKSLPKKWKTMIFYTLFFLFWDIVSILFLPRENKIAVIMIFLVVQYLIFYSLYDSQKHKSISPQELNRLLSGVFFWIGMVFMFFIPAFGRFFLGY